jgi:small subunit ribosomal protein S3
VRRPGANAAPADGSDKPAEATGGDSKPAVKRVRKDAPASAAADGKGE